MSAGKVSSYLKKIEGATMRKASKHIKRQNLKDMRREVKEYRA